MWWTLWCVPFFNLARCAFLRDANLRQSALSKNKVAASLRSDAFARAVPDLWAATAVEDHVQGMTQELELTRTDGDGWYTAQLQIGGNTSQVIVDTASPWLWSYGGGDEDSTVQDDDKPTRFSISYMSAELGGTVVSERVALHSRAAESSGSCKAGKATDGDQFWMRQYSKSGVQGVLGLACGTSDSGEGAASAASLSTGLNCVSSALAADTNSAWTERGSESETVFAVQLGSRGGKLSFGAPPFDLLPGLVQMPPSMRCGNWRAPLRVSLAASNGKADQDFGFSEAVLDSAALGIVGQSERVASLAKALGADIEVRDGGMVFVMPCSRAESLPIVELRLGRGREAHVQLSGKDMLIPDDPATGKQQKERSPTKEDGDEASSSSGSNAQQCRLIFAGWQSPQWLLGMPFFRAVRGVIFNPSTQAVSIAP